MSKLYVHIFNSENSTDLPVKLQYSGVGMCGIPVSFTFKLQNRFEKDEENNSDAWIQAGLQCLCT